MSRELTIGEKRIGINFDTATEDKVDRIKVTSAILINQIEEVKEENNSGDKLRTIATAQTNVETASMWAVKSCFVK